MKIELTLTNKELAEAMIDRAEMHPIIKDNGLVIGDVIFDSMKGTATVAFTEKKEPKKNETIR